MSVLYSEMQFTFPKSTTWLDQPWDTPYKTLGNIWRSTTRHGHYHDSDDDENAPDICVLLFL